MTQISKKDFERFLAAIGAYAPYLGKTNSYTVNGALIDISCLEKDGWIYWVDKESKEAGCFVPCEENLSLPLA